MFGIGLVIGFIIGVAIGLGAGYIVGKKAKVKDDLYSFMDKATAKAKEQIDKV